MLAVVAGCVPPPPAPRYVVGEPYVMGGVWSYPREDFSLAETGLATVARDARAGRRMANGEVHDPARASAAHRTLQLPAALRVTNLENGRTLLLRVNDRGPADAGRVLELSRRAADLLGVVPGGTAQVRIAVAPEESRALAASLRPREADAALPSDAVAAAPRPVVATEALAPPPGARGAAAAQARQTTARPATPVAPPADAGAAAVAFSERVALGAPSPGRLFVEAGTFSRREAAARQALRLARSGARVEAVGTGRQQQFRVRIGPLAGVAEADRILEQVLASGVSEARILVD